MAIDAASFDKRKQDSQQGGSQNPDFGPFNIQVFCAKGPEKNN